MKKMLGVLAVALTVAAFAFPLQAASRAWKGIALIDAHCAAKMADDPDAHPRSCALQCSKGGYGVITPEGKFLRFDKAGNEKALAALKNSEKQDHLRATVTGTLNGDVIAVSSIAID